MMTESEKKNSNLSLQTLKGMQSVRATFTLPKQAIHMLSTVASQLGVKQKSIFDHLVENKKALDRIVNEAQNYRPEPKKRRQKTFVLSRNSLKTLDHFAKTHKLPRDILVEYSLRQLRPVIDAEKRKHKNRQILLDDMAEFFSQGHRMLERARELLGEDDSTFKNLLSTMELFEKNIEELKLAVEKGKCMEEFQ